MNTIFAKTGLAAAALTASALAFPVMASANQNGYYGDGYHNTYNAHDACKRDEKKDKVTGAVIGAIIGGVVGANVAGDGVQGEGAVLGASIGSIAGAGIADKQTDCDPQYGYNDRYYDQRRYNQNGTVYGDGSYQQNGYNTGRYQQPAPRVVYRAPRPAPRVVYSPPRQPVYNRGGYYQTRSQSYTHPRYRSPAQRRKKAVRRAYKKGYRQGQAHGHYHGNHICYGTH